MGRIENVCSTSADFCLKLEALSTVPENHLETVLSAPRYRGTAKHWRSSLLSLQQDEPDYRNALRERLTPSRASAVPSSVINP